MTTNNKDKMPEGFLTGKAYFASVHSPSNKFRENKYVIQVLLEGDQLEKARKYNLNVKPASKHVPGEHIEVKKVVRGPQTKAPDVLDAANKPVPKNVLIGNGSEVKVKFGMYDNTKGKNGAYLYAVKIVKLVEYKHVSEEAQDFMAVEGEGLTVDEEADDAIVPARKTAGRTAVQVKTNKMDDEIPF